MRKTRGLWRGNKPLRCMFSKGMDVSFQNEKPVTITLSERKIQEEALYDL